jgi:dTDP-4-amino-4,6-dideoxygalactose transaminase
MIAISSPMIAKEEMDAVARVLESGQLAQGPRVAEFERAFAKFIGVRHAVAMSSGTSALHIALLAHGIGAGDEVITTPFTFIASINAILYTGARPVLVDVDESYNLNPGLIQAAITQRTKAIMPVHLYGQPADLGAIGEIARKHGLVLVEDACQAHGATFDGRRVGSFGTGCFSFYATKNMTTGEGGMITTDDDAVAERARLLINHGMPVRYRHETLGYNFRMTDMAAAIGVEQLKKLAGFNLLRARNAEFLSGRLGAIHGLVTPAAAPSRTHVWHQYTLRVTSEFPLARDALVEGLRQSGIGTGIYYPIPAHRQEALRGIMPEGVRLPCAEQFAREVISIPVHPGLSEADLEHIAATMEKVG